ncbi:Sulfate transporter [Thalictrum thalictroides]|uniref:Sulfate transporter n=1 Tax=Thalictrum thalictroides TaxID=46969 RepID=A0A7J6W6N2_THATH|nr:Sulfate transporter [Thalictrum thalictroides]
MNSVNVISYMTLVCLASFFDLVFEGISYAKLANLTPVIGLFVPLFLYAPLGSCRHLAVGLVSVASLVMGSMLEEASSSVAILVCFCFIQAKSTGWRWSRVIYHNSNKGCGRYGGIFNCIRKSLIAASMQKDYTFPRHWFSVDTRAVNEILGTCDSVGCTVDGKNPIDLQQEIVDGEVWFSQEADEGLNIWDWRDSRNEVDFQDACTIAFDSWTLGHVDYFVDYHYLGPDNRLWVISGTNAGSWLSDESSEVNAP